MDQSIDPAFAFDEADLEATGDFSQIADEIAADVGDDTSSIDFPTMDQAGGTLGAAAGSAKGALGSATDSAKDAFGAATDSASGALGSATGSVKGALSSVTDTAGGALGSAKGAVLGAAGAATAGAAGIAGKVGDKASDAMNDTSLDMPDFWI